MQKVPSLWVGLVKRQRSSSKPKKYQPNKFERTSEKIIYFAWIFDLICAGWFIYFETANIAVVGMLRTIYPFVMVPILLLPIESLFIPKGKKIPLKVFDTSFSKDGVVNTLLSKGLFWMIFLGLLFFTVIGIFQILKIIDAII